MKGTNMKHRIVRMTALATGIFFALLCGKALAAVAPSAYMDGVDSGTVLSADVQLPYEWGVCDFGWYNGTWTFRYCT